MQERDWEERYLQGDTPWDHGVAAPPLLEVLEAWPAAIWGGGPVLVPGCGRGHDAAALARAGHPAVGLDLSATAVREATARYGEIGRLDFLEGDFLAERIREERPVSAIWEHTLFCALVPDLRPAYVRSAARRLAPGQRLVGVFYLDPEPGDGPPFGIGREELQNLFSQNFEINREAVPKRFYESREGRELLVEMIRTP